jgi:hypothetical protein
MSDSTSKSIDYTPAEPEESIDYTPAEPEVDMLSGSESIDYTPASPEIEMPGIEDSDSDDVQILEPPPIPIVNLVSEEEDDDGEELEMDTRNNSEEKLDLMDTKNKKVMPCGKIRKTAKRTRIKSSPNPKRPKKDSEDSGYEGDNEMSKTKRTKGFWN